MSKSIHITTFKRESESLGESTVNFLTKNVLSYDFSILYPAGYDQNSIEFVIKHCKEMPLLIILNSVTYFEIFLDESYGNVYEYKKLAKNNVSKFKIK